MKIADLTEFAIQRNASDIHLSSGAVPVLRVDGKMVSTEFPPLTAEQMQALLDEMMPRDLAERFAELMDVDFAYSAFGVRFRVNAYCQLRGPGAVMRSIPNTVPKLDDLPGPDVLYKLMGLANGLVLLTGATGSGKSTTMAAMVRYINETSRRHVITLEDPIEFVHTNDFSLITQREVHSHSKSFSAALRAALREDPDVIMVGEMRDLETIRLALTASETGNLVIGSLHTSSATKAVARVVDVFPPEEKDLIRSRLAESLHAVVLQTLVERKGGGRIAAFEVMLATTAVRNLIRNGKIAQLDSVLQTRKDLGMASLAQSLEELLAKDLIEPEVAEKTIAAHSGF